MAYPASFDESNDVLGAPPNGMGDDECEALSILRTQTANGTPCIVSCWKLTADELAEISATGRVWLVVAGQRMFPVSVHGEWPETVLRG